MSLVAAGETTLDEGAFNVVQATNVEPKVGVATATGFYFQNRLVSTI